MRAVVPGLDGDNLHHTTWTKAGGWTKPVELEGHPSNTAPALLPFREGPAGAERDAFVLVHRGFDRYVPPAPPGHSRSRFPRT
ncbi:hypothetical protein [Streptomyces sp. NPDC056323]|uniref:hypothetical protein n=1 Tax=unclassified Streptomyces TaxID=2593676 RepID=UPI0035DD39CB